MTSEIQAQLIDGDNHSIIYTYSVREYADYLLAHASSQGTDEEKAWAKAAPLVEKMLQYGEYAKAYFDDTALDDIADVEIPSKFADYTSRLPNDRRAAISDRFRFRGFALVPGFGQRIPLFHKIVEVDLFALTCLGYLTVLAVHAVDVGFLFKVHEHRCSLLIVEGLLLAVECGVDGLHKDFAVDVNAGCGDVLGSGEAQDPAETVVLVIENRGFLGVNNYGASFVA